MLTRLVALLVKTAEGISAAAFAAMFLLFIAGVFARYVLAKPLVWSDELIMIIFLWMVFLTEAFVISEREQVRFDAVHDLVGERARRAIQAAGALAVAVMFLIALPTVLDYVRFLWRERSHALQWRLDILYSCFVIFWLAVIVRAVLKLVRLAGPGWRQEIAPTPAEERADVLG